LRSTVKNYIEFELDLAVETEMAINVSDGIGEYWIPKSQLEDDMEHLDNGMVRIVIPEWLAIEKEMV
jgi:hypothetical protein